MNADERRSILDDWAAKCPTVEAVIALIETLEQGGKIEWLAAEKPREVVMEWFEVNESRLDEARRDLLEEHRRSSASIGG